MEPLDGMCLLASAVYNGEVTETVSGKVETYTGLTEGPFKGRWNQHNTDSRLVHNRGRTALSEHLWKLKDAGISYTIKWKILRTAPAFKPSNKKCPLCLMEKFYIIFHPKEATLNVRSELSTFCRHKRKYLLSRTVDQLTK